MSEGEIQVDGYQLLNCIATGTATQVWEVVPKSGGERKAMKLMLKEALAEKELVSVLKHEAKIGKQLEHPNIIRTHELVVNKRHAYIIMEYFRSLNVKVQIGTDRTGLLLRFPRFVEQTCLALEYIHEKGYLHRDIKPDNILFNRSSELKLIDFSLSSRYAKGIAKAFSGKLKVIQGTRTYLAPELLLKQQPTTQTDMYSLGITLYEVLTGDPPFRGSSPANLLAKHLKESVVPPSEYNSNITPEMDTFVLNMLKKKPKDRPSTMSEVMAAFRNLKPFKEDVANVIKREEEKAEALQKQSLDEAQRLDSRSDAQKQEIRKKDPNAFPQKAPKPKPGRPAIKEKAASSEPKEQPQQTQPAAQTPQQPYPQQPFPQQPYQAYPQQPYQGQPLPPGMYPPQPQQPYPGQPYPQQPYQGQPYPPQPYPPQPYPGQPIPGQPYAAPGTPAPGAPPPQADLAQPPPAQSQPGPSGAVVPQQPTSAPPATEQPPPEAATADSSADATSGAPAQPAAGVGQADSAPPAAETRAPGEIPNMDELPPVS